MWLVHWIVHLFRALIWNDKGYSALQAQDRLRAHLTRAWRLSEVEARDVRLKRLKFDVVNRLAATE